jgi:hypothetical protein
MVGDLEVLEDLLLEPTPQQLLLEAVVLVFVAAAVVAVVVVKSTLLLVLVGLGVVDMFVSLRLGDIW